MKFASIVVLSYNRPEYLRKSIVSLHQNTIYPYELIIVDDGSTDRSTVAARSTQRLIFDLLVRTKAASTAIFNCGKNIGIGAGLNRGFGIAKGDYLVKADADFEYKKGWLTEAVDLVETFPEVGILGLFHYHWDPCDHKKKYIEYKEREARYVEIVEDFVGLGVMRREVWEKNGPFSEDGRAFAEDVDYKLRLQDRGYLLGLPVQDKVVNVGFGETSSSLIKSVGIPGDATTYTYNVPTQERLIFVEGKPIPYNGIDNHKGWEE